MRNLDKTTELASSIQQVCRVCGGGDLIKHTAVHQPVTRSGIFYHCKACESLSFHATENEEAYGESYYGNGNSKVGGLAQLLRTFSAVRRADFANKISISSGLCLDIGCGDGEFLKAMQDRHWEVKGTELPGPAFERASGKLPGQVICTPEFENIVPFDSCALITMWQVFEHLENPRKVLENCRKLLTSDGILAIGVPNPLSWQSQWGAGDWLHLDPPRHLHLLEVDAFLKLATSCGYKRVTIRHSWIEFGPIGWIQTLLNKVGFPRDSFLERMKDRWRGVSWIHRMSWMSVATLFVLPAFVLALLESFAKCSATYEVYLRRD